MDYQTEQEMELEALQAILMDDLVELEERHVPTDWDCHGKCWKVAVVPMEDGQPLESSNPMRMELVFAHTPEYPEQPPLYKVRNLRGLSDAQLAECTSLLAQVVEENLGMAMVYNLITAAQDWLADKLGGGIEPELSEAELKAKAMEEEEKRMAELRRYGTPVTPEHFEAWRNKFKAEMELQNASVAESASTDKKGRMTGKQWFLQQEQAGVQVSEVPSEEDEESFQEEQRRALEARAAQEDDEDDNDDFDPDELDDDDEDEMLDDYLAAKA